MNTLNESSGSVFAEAYADPVAESWTAEEAEQTWESRADAAGEWEAAFEDLDEREDESIQWEGGVEEAAYELETESPFAAETGARPLLMRGRRGPDVSRAQGMLNRFLSEIVRGPQMCVDRSPQRIAHMRTLLLSLQQNRQLPLKVDGVFGPNTERATQLFQACLGLVRDGKIGTVTWQYLERQPGRGRRRNPLDPPNPTCGVPERSSAELEHELDLEREMLHETRRRTAVAARARLSLFQNTSKAKGRTHLEAQATRVARLLSTYANPRADRCSDRRVGPTAYDTGADIIAAITAAHTCLRRRISAVHIFGHAFSGGVIGTTPESGLYIMAAAADRARGARSISDIPVAALADDVVVVLHGCNQASGSDSFAEQLYRHLAATLTSPIVIGHPNSGCAGRDNSWRQFDSRAPAGRGVRSVAPHYSGRGHCPAPQRREAADEDIPADYETELEAAWSSMEWEEPPVAAGGRPCGCGRRSASSDGVT